MEVQNSIKTEYDSFRNKLTKTIKDFPNNYFHEDCYLVEQFFIKKIEKYFNEIIEAKRQYNYSQQYINTLNIEETNIIKDFKTMIDFINNDIKISLVSKRLIELMDFKNILNNNNKVVYYGGNGKLIIEYKNNSDNISLLMFNPKRQDKENIFLIKKKESYISYQNLLDQINNINDTNKYSFIISFKDYIDSNNNAINKNNYQNKNFTNNNIFNKNNHDNKANYLNYNYDNNNTNNDNFNYKNNENNNNSYNFLNHNNNYNKNSIFKMKMKNYLQKIY
jgi:hypothetical protein